MGRQAILIANSISYGERSKNISISVIKSLIEGLDSSLSYLGEYSFRVNKVVNETKEGAQRRILNEIRSAGRQGDMVLMYYFGHAVKSNDEELYLFFKKSKWEELPTMIRVGELVGWLGSYRIPKVIMIFDCCYGGTVAKKLRLLDAYGGEFYLMASVTPREKALVDYKDERPIGVFSKFLMDGFNNPKSRLRPTRDVTFKSMFDFINKKTKKRSKQTPYDVDGGLQSEIFFKQTTKLFIPNGLKTYVPKKSSYKKIFIICTYLLIKTFDNETIFYNFLKEKEPEEFLTPVKVSPGRVEYEFIGQESFRKYLVLCRVLELLEIDDPLRLSARGKRMTRSDGKLFNYELFGALKKIWKRYGLEFADFEDIISDKLLNNEIPTLTNIYRDMYLSKKVYIEKEIFRILLDLTGYVGALKHTNDRTFFPPFTE